jgi:uncharacterized protein (TIGR03067 family)
MRAVVVLAALWLVPGLEKQDAAKKDLDALQGTWVMVALEVDGKPVPEEKIKGARLVVKGDKYITQVKGKDYETIITLDPSKKPKAIDMVFTEGDKKDKVLRGIYLIEGDTLKVCRGLRPEQDRPTEFGTWPNTNLFLVTWKKKTP